MLREYGLDPQPIRELLKATVTRVYQNTWAACAYRGICAIPDTIFSSHKSVWGLATYGPRAPEPRDRIISLYASYFPVE